MPATKEISLEEVKKHNKPDDLWVIIWDKVYDLTKFRAEHPGGEDTLDDASGRDATKDFVEVGHSSEAREMMAKYLIGELAVADRKQKLHCRKFGIAFGAVLIGIAAVFIVKRVLSSRS